MPHSRKQDLSATQQEGCRSGWALRVKPAKHDVAKQQYMACGSGQSRRVEAAKHGMWKQPSTACGSSQARHVEAAKHGMWKRPSSACGSGQAAMPGVPGRTRSIPGPWKACHVGFVVQGYKGSKKMTLAIQGMDFPFVIFLLSTPIRVPKP